MSTNVRVYRIMIASPSDVTDERKIIKEAMEYWNYRYGLEYQIMFIPLLWEYDSYPAMGDNPQTLLDRQLCDRSDMLVAIFWSKLGTPTTSFPSGTVEEIYEHKDKGKPVFLYFNKAPLSQDHDPKQFSKLRKFKEGIRDSALYCEYDDKKELKDIFIEQLRTAVKDNPYFAVEDQSTHSSVEEKSNGSNTADNKDSNAEHSCDSSEDCAIPAFSILINDVENEIDLTINNEPISEFFEERMKQYSDDAKLILSDSIPKKLLPYIDKTDMERFRDSIHDEDALMEYLSKWRRFLFMSQQEPVELECRVWNKMDIFAEEIHVFIDKPQKIYLYSAESIEAAKKVIPQGYSVIPNPLDVARQNMKKKIEEGQMKKSGFLWEQYKKFRNSTSPSVKIMPPELPHIVIPDSDSYISVEDDHISMYLKQLSQSLHRGFSQKLYALPLEAGKEEINVTYICKQVKGKINDFITIKVIAE